MTGIWKWNGGDGSALGNECKSIDTSATPDSSDSRVRTLLSGGGKLNWAGCTECLTLSPDGALHTIWGDGRWGVASTRHFPHAAFVYFFSVMHMLQIKTVRAYRRSPPVVEPGPSKRDLEHSPDCAHTVQLVAASVNGQIHSILATLQDGTFISTRCSDGEQVKGSVASQSHR